MNSFKKFFIVSLFAALPIRAADLALIAPLEKPTLTINAPAMAGEQELKRKIAGANGATFNMNYALDDGDDAKVCEPQKGVPGEWRESLQYRMLKQAVHELGMESRVPSAIQMCVASYLHNTQGISLAYEMEIPAAEQMLVTSNTKRPPYVVVGAQKEIDVYAAATGRKLKTIPPPLKQGGCCGLCCGDRFSTYWLLPSRDSDFSVVSSRDAAESYRRVASADFETEWVDTNGAVFEGRYKYNGEIEIRDVAAKKIVASCQHWVHSFDGLRPEMIFFKDEKQKFWIAISWHATLGAIDGRLKEVEIFSVDDRRNYAAMGIGLFRHTSRHPTTVRKIFHYGGTHIMTITRSNEVRIIDALSKKEVQKTTLTNNELVYDVTLIPSKNLMIAGIEDANINSPEITKVQCWDCAPILEA